LLGRGTLIDLEGRVRVLDFGLAKAGNRYAANVAVGV